MIASAGFCADASGCSPLPTPPTGRDCGNIEATVNVDIIAIDRRLDRLRAEASLEALKQQVADHLAANG